MKAFLSTRHRSIGKNRNKKIDLLNSKKKEIMKYITSDDEDFFYYVTEEYKMVSDDIGSAKTVEKRLKEYEGEKIYVRNIDNQIAVVFPKVTSAKTFKDVNDILFTLTRRKENPIQFNKQGKASESTLLKLGFSPLFGAGELSSAVRRRSKEGEVEVEGETKNKYKASATELTHLLEYFMILQQSRGKGWNKPEFMVAPRNKNFRKADAMTQLLISTSKPFVSPSLRSILISDDFNIDEILESATMEHRKKFVPNAMRQVLAPNPSTGKYDNFGLTTTRRNRDTGIMENVELISQSDMAKLRNKFKKSAGEMNKFLDFLRGNSAEAKELLKLYNELEKHFEQAQERHFTEEEKDFLISIKEEEIEDMEVKLAEFYQTDSDVEEIADNLDTFFDSGGQFIRIEETGNYRPKSSKNMKLTDMRSMLDGFTQLRSQMAGENIDTNLTYEDLLLEYDEEFEMGMKPYKPNSTPEPAELLHVIVILDFYYGNRQLKRLENQFFDADREGKKTKIKEMLEWIKTNYSTLSENLLDSLNTHLTDMLDNKDKYISLLEFKTKKGKRTYKMFNTLLSAGLIEEVTQG